MTSGPIVLETFTFLDRNTERGVALKWQRSLDALDLLSILDCTVADVGRAWPYLRRKDLHKLSAVDATSFALMEQAGLRIAFTFDHHFAVAGFRLVG